MRRSLDDDLDDELGVFAALAKRAWQRGYTLARTPMGYRLGGHGETVHRVDLDGMAQVVKDRLAMAKNLTKPEVTQQKHNKA
jgi:hypothetical protein